MKAAVAVVWHHVLTTKPKKSALQANVVWVAQAGIFPGNWTTLDHGTAKEGTSLSSLLLSAFSVLVAYCLYEQFSFWRMR